jgi:hypothetical protein
VTGGSLSGGGFGAIPIRQTGLALTFGARVVASTVAPAGNKSATVYEAGGIFTWN